MNSQARTHALLCLVLTCTACGRRDYDIGSEVDADIARMEVGDRVDASIFETLPSLPDANYPDVAPLAEDALRSYCATRASDPACLVFDAASCASLNASIVVFINGALARYSPSRHEVVYDVPNVPGFRYGSGTSPIDLAMGSDTGVLIVQDFIVQAVTLSLHDGTNAPSWSGDTVDAEFWSGGYVGPRHNELLVLRRAEPAATSNRWAVYRPAGARIIASGEIDFPTGNAYPPQLASTPEGRAFLLVPSVGLVEFNAVGAVLGQTPIDGLPALERTNDFTFHEGAFYVFFSGTPNTEIWRFELPVAGRSAAVRYDSVRGAIQVADAPHCYAF